MLEYFIILMIIWLIFYSYGPVITNKLNISRKIYLNKEFTKIKAKYHGLFLLICIIILLVCNYNIISSVNGYVMLIQAVIIALFAISLILRDDYLNQKYIPKNENEKKGKYFLDFTKSAFIPIILACALSEFLMTQNVFILNILVMIFIVIELIMLIIAACPDKLYEYFTLNNYNFTYSGSYYIILLISIVPMIIFVLLLVLLSYM